MGDEMRSQNTFKMANAAYTQYSNLPYESLPGKRVSEVFPGHYQTEAFKNYVHTYETGIPGQWEIHYDQDGLDVYLQVATTKVKGEVLV